jgi:hypothetical protein
MALLTTVVVPRVATCCPVLDQFLINNASVPTVCPDRIGAITARSRGGERHAGGVHFRSGVVTARTRPRTGFRPGVADERGRSRLVAARSLMPADNVPGVTHPPVTCQPCDVGQPFGFPRVWRADPRERIA